ncbi:MAG: S8 family serine peptidase [Prevotella sp.]|nr:S8 family serine peptidase [Prevotella sp.]
MKKLLLLIAFIAGTFLVSFAQKATKISPSTRIVIADRDGKLSLDAAKKEMVQMKKNKRNAPWKAPSATETTAEDEDDGDGFPFATPTYVNGVKVVQCWIGMTDDNYNAIEALGVKIQAKFDGKVTANVPVDALEKVAELANVTKVSVSKKLKKKTYRSRILTNVDDVLTHSADAQTAGLLQAYDGTGVVLGVIDTGIDFGHQMFSGRIKKKYVYNTTAEELQEYTGSSVYYTDETHGTHTSSIAGGSDYTATAYVYTTSTSYTTVSNAKFGGMAPGTDLVLCDLGEELTDANIAACIKNISDYADQVGKPCVISLSLGGHFGPHDGTGDMADVCAQYTGAGKIILFASGNEGEDGIYHYKNASASAPAMTVLSSQTRSSYSVDYGVALSYARTPNVELAVRYYVVNTSRNTILWTSNEITTDDYFVDDEGNIELYGAEISVNDTGSDGTTKLSSYFTAYNNDSQNYGYLCGYMEKDEHNNKWYVETILYYLKPVNSSYKIGMSVYPKNGSCYVDSWPAVYIDFASSSASVNGNTFTAGTNESSASDEASFPSIISVGSYVSSKYWRAGTTSASNQTWTNNGTYQQISMFSSYQAEGSGPTGLKQPWITAPGEVIIAAYNSGYSVESNVYYAYGTNKKLGAMSGTSMATPCAAGITALWLQVDPTLTPDKVKEVMKETAIKDSYVTGTYASHFGQGKIDALAGIEYILEHANNPTITAEPTSLTFETTTGIPVSETFNVTGENLEGNITATLTDANNVYSLSSTSVSVAQAENGKDITVTFSPTTAGTFTGAITLSSSNATSVTVNLSGTATTPELMADPEELVFDVIEAGQTTTKTFDVLGVDLIGNVTATLTDANGVFSLDATTISQADAEEGATVTVTFAPQAQGTYTGTVTLSSDRAESITVQLNATATKAMPDYFDVTISSVGLTTLYLDFPVEIPYQSYDPDLLGVYYLTGRNGNELRAARLNSNIPANTGVIVQGNSGTYRFPKTSNPTELKYTSILSGSVEDITPAEALAAAQSTGTVYTLGRGKDSYINFYKYSGSTLAAYKAFLILEDSNAKAFSMVFEDGTTGIIALDADNNDGAWYTVQGIKLIGKPIHKGLYIHNGKTVTIK